jgi:hypothetical protein
MAKRKIRTFVQTIDGSEVVQVAHTPGDAVALTFNGWREVLDEQPTTTTAAATESGSASAPKKAATRVVDKSTK